MSHSFPFLKILCKNNGVVMSNNINQNPTLDATSPIMKSGSAVKAIIFSSLVDILGGMVLGVITGVIYAAFQIYRGVSTAEIASVAQHIDLLSPLGIFSLIGGFLTSFYAGYLCAKMSVTNIYRNAAVVCSISVCFSVFVGMDSYTVIENLVMAVIAILAIFWGAYTFKKK